MEIKSTSKINIGLHVHNKRSDGFHNISTLFQEIDFCDIIKIQEKKEFSCITDCGDILEADNFGTKAFNILKSQHPEIPNVNILIKKNYTYECRTWRRIKQWDSSINGVK